MPHPIRRALAFSLIVAPAFALSGCGETPTPTPTPVAPVATTTVSSSPPAAAAPVVKVDPGPPTALQPRK